MAFLAKRRCRRTVRNMERMMTDLPKIVVTGASGRMGQMLCQTISQSNACTLVGAIERAGHDWIGRDIGVAMGSTEMGVIVSDDALAAFAQARQSLISPLPKRRLSLRPSLHKPVRCTSSALRASLMSRSSGLSRPAVTRFRCAREICLWV